jgi:hypothetical protein
MGDQTSQRRDLASQAAVACQDLIDVLTRLELLAERRPYLGNFVAADFTNTSLAYLGTGEIGTLFDFVVPSLLANFEDAANGGRNKQIAHQVAGSV